MNNDRLVFLMDDIEPDSIRPIIRKILQWEAEDDKKVEENPTYERQPIELYISSYGGDVYCALGLIDVIRESETPVYTCAYGMAMSAALYIFMVGHQRICGKNATFMLHDISEYGLEGTRQQHKEAVIEMDNISNLLIDILIEKTKIKKSKIEKIFNSKRDWYFQANEAKKLGVTDYINS